MPLCTVVLVNYNSWTHLEKCLILLSKQSFRDFSVCIVDNASDQPPPETLLSIWPDTVLIRNSSNNGFAAANNQIFSKAVTSEWFILLNPDAFPEPDFITKLLHTAETHPDINILGGRLFVDSSHHRIDGDGDNYHLCGYAWRERRAVLNSNEPFEVFSACAAAIMIRPEIIEKYGGFDEDFFCYMEDVDFGFKMRLVGQRCLIVPDAVAYHVGSATSGGQHSDFARYHGHRNLVWTYVKNMPGVLFWLFLPLHCAFNLVSLLWFSLKGQGRVILRAKMDALRGLPKMWHKRKMIQRQRVVPLASILRLMDKSPIPRMRNRVDNS